MTRFSINRQVKSVFTKEDLQNMTPGATSPYADIPTIRFSMVGITKLVQKVDCKKANRPDGIPCYILKEAAAELAPFLQFLVTQSLHTGSLPQAWLKVTVVSVHKKGDRSQVDNYGPISLTWVPCKIMEHIIFHEMMSHLHSNQVLVNYLQLACNAGVFFDRAICSRKRHVETSRREEEMRRVKGSGEGAGREKRKRPPENTVKMRNNP